ncbi:hypothetical protein [Pseudomonas sp. PH1b]|uniref:hypothetical protein n=1 Tax=Pseudomonas sp. PH1b TaxID=1397282 RepID=UPI0004699C4A|nr:hypothetical protein [Pseudomonas sp. PH1b]
MQTDWQQIRDMMNTVIDSCEQIENSGYGEAYRSARVSIDGRDYSVHEFLISAWTLPENIRYQIIQERHDQGASLPYVPESARALVAMAQACAELIGAGEKAPAQQAIKGMNHWYRQYAVPHIRSALEQAKKHGA